MGDSLTKLFIHLVLLSVLLTTTISVFLGSPTRGQAVQDTTRTYDLMGLQLSKEQVQSGSLEGEIHEGFLGSVGYVQGSFEGRPVTYIYIRYREEGGDIIDRLIPRDQVRLRDDLDNGKAATLEIHTVKKRDATYEDIQRDPSLCYEGSTLRDLLANFMGSPSGEKRLFFIRKGTPLPAEQCGRHETDAPTDWNLDHEELVVHVPKDAIIVTINPNMVPEGAKKG